MTYVIEFRFQASTSRGANEEQSKRSNENTPGTSTMVPAIASTSARTDSHVFSNGNRLTVVVYYHQVIILMTKIKLFYLFDRRSGNALS